MLYNVYSLAEPGEKLNKYKVIPLSTCLHNRVRTNNKKQREG